MLAAVQCECAFAGCSHALDSVSDTSCRVFSVLFSFLAFLHERRYPTSLTYLRFLYDYVGTITILVRAQDGLDDEGEFVGMFEC